VQRVIRPDHTFRGFAGQIASGTVRPGDAVTVLPSGRAAKVERIVTWNGDLEEACAPLSVALVLDHELDVSRGDLIAAAETPAATATRLEAAVVWMDKQPLDLNRRYFAKHASHTVPAFISSIEHRTNVATLEHEPAATLEMNSIGVVTVSLLRPIAFDRYAENRSTGAFILIDPETNGTVAAGMISSALAVADAVESGGDNPWGPVTAAERQARWGHRGGVLELSAPASLIDSIERSLFSAGVVSSRISADSDEFLLHPNLLDIVTSRLRQSGLLALVVRANQEDGHTARVEGHQIDLDAGEPGHAVSSVHQLLHRAGIFISFEKANL